MSDSVSRPLDSATALLVVDVQVALISGAFRETEVLAQINQMIGKMRAGGGEVIFVQHNQDSAEDSFRCFL